MSLKNRISSEERRKKLKDLLDKKKTLKFIEAHDGISAIISNETRITNNKGEIIEFDGIWESSFTDSASKGYPDADIITIDSRCETLRYILDATNKPVIFDGDTGGDPTNFEFFVKRLENMGVSMVLIEDKTFPKRNSLDPECSQIQEDPNRFAIKIRRGKEVITTNDFMIGARIESFISGAGLKDAISRAKIYLEAGVDAIMIHSKDESPRDILEFSKEYNKLSEELGYRKPLICVPTTYNTISAQELENHGFNIIIYANHLLRASHRAMKKAAKKILKHGRTIEVESLCTPLEDIFDEVGLSTIKKKDKKYQIESLQVIIPAAGKDKSFDIPKSMIQIKNKTILQRQIDVLKKFNLNNIFVIRGFKKRYFDVKEVTYIDNNEYDNSYIVHSLFLAEEYLKNGFLYINSDILFNEYILSKILDSSNDIILVVDRSYKYHKHEIDKKLDMVMTKKRPTEHIWQLYDEENEVLRIGKKIKLEDADYEYIGIAYFSKYGAKILRNVYHDCLKNSKGQFHEAKNFRMADFMDLIQEIIDRGFTVNIVEVHKGWIEINDEDDVKSAELMI
ncbi:MAG: phosphoenolpyruvate mutase [Candidatus Hermodarchaeota archaeon]